MHPSSLISTFVVHCIDRIIPILAIAKILKTLASLCSWAGRFESYLVANPEDRFSRDEAQMLTIRNSDISGVVCKWAASWQNQQNDCAPSENSDQPGQTPSLIRVFAVRMKKAWVLSYPLSAQWNLRSDWADAQADRWAHTHFVGFVTSWLNCIKVLCIQVLETTLCHHEVFLSMSDLTGHNHRYYLIVGTDTLSDHDSQPLKFVHFSFSPIHQTIKACVGIFPRNPETCKVELALCIHSFKS